MVPQAIINIPEICHQLGVRHVIISPGSRNAPLTLSFARYHKIDKHVIPDERSAGFIGLGIAQKTKEPVALICTSGSAAYNLAPAVAEAFFQQIKLLVFTADRPPEWIDQYDGQTIHQQHIFGSHVKKFYQFPDQLNHPDVVWHGTRIISEAINISRNVPEGPVHVNFPFREPFYPAAQEKFKVESQLKVIEASELRSKAPGDLLDACKKEIAACSSVAIMGGQGDYSPDLVDAVDAFGQTLKVPVIGDGISNLHSFSDVIKHADSFIDPTSQDQLEHLAPKLLITFGKSAISKNLKLFLRKCQNLRHWHLQPGGVAADTYQKLTRHIQVDPAEFLNSISNNVIVEPFEQQQRENFLLKWRTYEEKTQKIYKDYRFNEFCQIGAVREILDNIPGSCDLHLANSMSVRWANFVSIPRNDELEVWCNRGTSGIDGSVSTALGNSLVSKKLTVLITGDLAFFYDRNSFWNNCSKRNLKVIILNNHAGGIFGLINGPSEQPELIEYFETTQNSKAEHTAKEHGLEYVHCSNLEELSDVLPSFWERSDTGGILELEFDNNKDKSEFRAFRQFSKEKLLNIN